MTRRTLLALAAVLLPASLAAGDTPPAVPLLPDLSGEWSGYWISNKNGHHGPLKATVTKMGEDCYQVRFKGRFALIVPFRYATPMMVVGTDAGVVLLGASKKLGPVLGTFDMSATATATNFEANFTSKNDCGKFVLTRCGCR